MQLNSIANQLMLDALPPLLASIASIACRMVFLLVLSLLLTYLNYRGLHVVGNFAITTTILIAMPFLFLCALALPQAQPSNWLKVRLGLIDRHALVINGKRLRVWVCCYARQHAGAGAHHLLLLFFCWLQLCLELLLGIADLL